MNDNYIYKIRYKKNPEIHIWSSFNILFFIFLFVIGVGFSLYDSDLYSAITIITICIFIIIPIIYWYLPVFKSLSLYKSLTLYKDKIEINNDEVLINQINTEISNIHKGTKLIYASWRSLIIYDLDNNKIGEFFFEIGSKESILNATEKSLAEVINDIKQHKIYDYKDKIIKDYKAFKKESKSYNIGIILLILVFTIPAVISLIFALTT